MLYLLFIINGVNESIRVELSRVAGSLSLFILELELCFFNFRARFDHFELHIVSNKIKFNL